jgi:galactokinase
MDQMACAVGGTISLDFAKDVVYKKVDFSFSEFGYDFVIVNTGKGHADLSHEYSEIPGEMRLVANELGAENLSGSNLKALLDNYTKIEHDLSNDRAILRALHFYAENKRVEDGIAAIEKKDGKQFLNIITESGNSSWKWLQNVYVASNPKEQKMALALALTETYLKEIGAGACRVHGGGFSGVIASIVPKAKTEDYIKYMSKFVGEENVYLMGIRQVGAVHIG